MHRLIAVSLAAVSGCAMAVWALADDAPAVPQAHFHHVHVNAIDPAASVKFYSGKFEAEPKTWAGQPAVFAYKGYIVFNKAAAPPPSDIVSGIWHMGFGFQDIRAEYQKQLDSGTRFETPLTDISDLAGRPANSGSLLYAYVDGPDHELTEIINTNPHHFNHVHMLSADPVAAAEWYGKHLGIPVRGRQPQQRLYQNHPVGPSASLQADHVGILFFPADYSKVHWPDLWKTRTALEPTRGRSIDHIAFSVDDLAATIARLRREGVTVLKDLAPVGNGDAQSAFVEGPDRVWVELVQDRKQ